MKAVVARELGQIAVEHVELASPRAGEVLVRMRATGVCHSDLPIINGTVGHSMPTVMAIWEAAVSKQWKRAAPRFSRTHMSLHPHVPQCVH